MTIDMVRKSICWPTGLFKHLCGDNGLQGIPHPKTDCDFKGVIATESIEQWAERFYKWFERLSITTI